MGVIKILGAFGNRGVESHTTCIQISPNSIIDAGNIINGLGENAKDIDNIFITHSHLDHIVESAFLCDIYFANRKKPLKIYALKETIRYLKEHIFNWTVWPDFSEIDILNSDKKFLEFIEVKPNVTIDIEKNIKITPFLSNHTIECCGYIVEDNESGIMFTSDTYKNDNIWKILNENKKITSLIIDVSFPSSLKNVARLSKHLTPKLLKEELKKLKRDDIKIFINHLKPNYKEKIISEIDSLRLDVKVLFGGEIIDYKKAKIVSEERQSHISKVKKLNKIGISLSSNSDIDSILDLIVTEARGLTGADGGTLYLLDKNGDRLDFKVVQNDSLNIRLGGKNEKINWTSIPLYLENGRKNLKMVAAVCALEDRVINIDDVYRTKDYDFSGTREFDKRSGFRSRSMLVVPLKNHEKKIIGVLQLINKNGLYGTIPFDLDDEEITLSLASQAAVSLSNAALVEDLEKLLESFLKSINFALGKKSSFTANHVKKMVALSKMIAKAVSESDVFSDKFFTKDELKQINFAALMHDVGKLSTPDYILEKANKLDTLFDRMELIKTRALAIKNGLEIELLKNNISKDEYLENKKFIDDSLRLIEKSNKGSEFLSDEILEKIGKIETFSFQIQGEKRYLITKEEAKMLKIRKGTLSDEERDIINDHAKISLEILQKLPFPEKYKDIPQIAGAHHEKLNGKGYPLGLKDEDISFEARILAISDIFEALTADDRPYKEPNKLSTAMKILHNMAKDGELDMKLVRFFYESGLYLKFARKLLKNENIDEVRLDFG